MARLGEREDDAVHVRFLQDAFQVREPAQHRHLGAAAVGRRLAAVEEPQKLDVILGVLGDLGRHRVAHVPRADDQHPLAEGPPPPDEGARTPAHQRHREARQCPEDGQRGQRSMQLLDDDEHDGQPPAPDAQRHDSLGEVVDAGAAQAAPGGFVEAEHVEDEQPVRDQREEEEDVRQAVRREGQEDTTDAGGAVQERDPGAGGQSGQGQGDGVGGDGDGRSRRRRRCSGGL